MIDTITRICATIVRSESLIEFEIQLPPIDDLPSSICESDIPTVSCRPTRGCLNIYLYPLKHKTIVLQCSSRSWRTRIISKAFQLKVCNDSISVSTKSHTECLSCCKRIRPSSGSSYFVSSSTISIYSSKRACKSCTCKIKSYNPISNGVRRSILYIELITKTRSPVVVLSNRKSKW